MIIQPKLAIIVLSISLTVAAVPLVYKLAYQPTRVIDTSETNQQTPEELIEELKQDIPDITAEEITRIKAELPPIKVDELTGQINMETVKAKLAELKDYILSSR
jgi:hypothetical protein